MSGLHQPCSAVLVGRCAGMAPSFVDFITSSSFCTGKRLSNLHYERRSIAVAPILNANVVSRLSEFICPMLKLDPATKYLLSRPRGGLNDVLVQLEKSRRYAARFQRVLILDLTRSGMRMGFDALFTARDYFGCDLIVWTPAMGPVLDQCPSVFPAPLTGRVSAYTANWHTDGKQYCDAETAHPVNFDHHIDYSEQLLIYEQAGGGSVSLCALRHLCFSTEVANQVARRLIPIGTGYDAVHVRHTDYETDYEMLFEKSAAMFHRRRLLVCSDSKKVKDYAESCFGPTTELISVSSFPDLNGEPLFMSDKIAPHDAAVDLLSDLIAMARSDVFLFAGLQSNRYTVKYSGFSILAEVLRQEPATIRSLFANADPQLLKDMFETRPVQNGNGLQRQAWELRSWFFRVGQWRWNYKARHTSWRLKRRLRRNPGMLGEISPLYREQPAGFASTTTP